MCQKLGYSSGITPKKTKLEVISARAIGNYSIELDTYMVVGRV